MNRPLATCQASSPTAAAFELFPRRLLHTIVVHLGVTLRRYLKMICSEMHSAYGGSMVVG